MRRPCPSAPRRALPNIWKLEKLRKILSFDSNYEENLKIKKVYMCVYCYVFVKIGSPKTTYTNSLKYFNNYTHNVLKSPDNMFTLYEWETSAISQFSW